MFSVRVKLWHGIGTIVEECPNSMEAIRLAGLDWKVEQSEGIREVISRELNKWLQMCEVYGASPTRYIMCLVGLAP